jgi:hypothetical protein
MLLPRDDKKDIPFQEMDTRCMNYATAGCVVFVVGHIGPHRYKNEI